MKSLLNLINDGSLDKKLTYLYGSEKLAIAHERCLEVINGFSLSFDYAPENLFSAPGRTELGGNHTDHQHGRVIAASVDIDLLAAVSPTENGVIRVQSNGYPLITVSLDELTPKAKEKNGSAALIRGVAARMAELGSKIGGFDAYIISDVPGGSGLSSSAAFEVLIGTIINSLWGENKFNAVEIAQIGQYAENVFFGKPCGLMDQTACSVGGVVAIDFADTKNPVVEQIDLDLTSKGYALCIIDSGADHADLTDEYSAITNELKAVCRCFGKEVLREIDESEFLLSLPEVRKAAGDRAAVRAFHIYFENKHAADEAQALRDNDFEKFLAIARESGRSSAMYLQNVIPTGQTTYQELMFTIAFCENLLGGKGAVRVHGGGFAGTAQAFVPLGMLADFKAKVENVLGVGSCHVVTVRPVGGFCLA